MMWRQLRSMAFMVGLPTILTVGCGGETSPAPTETVKASVAALNPGCTGSPTEIPGAAIWAQIYGDAKTQHGRQLAVTPSGDILATGQFLGNVIFGTNTLVNVGGEDAWLSKLSPAGTATWSFNFGSTAAPPLYTYGLALASDASDNTFLAGQLTGDANFGGGTLTSAGSDDVFITKRDANGAHLWSKRYGDSAAQYVLGVATDTMGNLFVVGYFAGTLDFGTGPLTSAGNFDIYIAKLDGATGNGVWARRYGDASIQNAWGLGVDAAGGVTFAGNFAGTVDFGGGAFQSPAASDYDAFAVHLDSAGNHVWSRKFGGTGSSSLACMTVDSAGNTLLSGSFLGNLNVGSTPLTATNLDDAFLAKLDSAGNTVWSVAFPGNDFQRVVDVAADSAGNVVIAGRLKGDANFGGGLLTSAGDEDLFVAEYSPAGAHLWSKRYGDVQAQTATGVVVDANDDIVVSGGLYGAMDFGTGALTSAGNRDIFLAKIAGMRCQDACLGQPDGTACDDGNACTTGDSCQAGVCVSSGGCDDGNGCTDDVCDAVNGCLHVNNSAACDDGNVCTTGDVCQAGVCAGVAQGDPDGDGVCTGVDNCPNDFNPSQNDGNADGIGDACTPVCVSIRRGVNGTLADTGVRFGTPTTAYGSATDILAGTTGYPLFQADLSAIPANVQLSSASLTMVVTSTAVSTLEVHRITAPWVEATTTWNSFASAFDATVWTAIGNGAPNTLAPITFDILPLVQAWYAGTYTNYGLLIRPISGTTTKVATSESVSSANRPLMTICYKVPEAPSGCLGSPNGTPCDDGDACTANDACASGVCVAGPATNCDDGNACTDDSCSPASGCAHANNAAACDDGNLCTQGDACSGGTCVAGAAMSCDDNNGCTDDTCDAVLGACVHANNAAACDDGDPCTLGDACQAGTCAGTPAGGTCDPCAQPGMDGTACNDGNSCTQGDVCTAGVCVGLEADSDMDGVCDAVDNCPTTYNPLQADANLNGQGDTCEVVCQTFQRGVLGAIADTTVNSSTPSTPSGVAPSIKSSTSFGNKWYALIRADISSLPLTAQVVSSTLTLDYSSTFALQVNAHRVTSSWIESVETWNSFSSAFSPAIESSATSTPPSGSISFDLTSLTQSWRDLTVPNYGVLLEQAQGQTLIVSSEVPNVATRPRLTVCFVVPDASCVDGDACDDGDGCTTGDVCHLGICSGNPSGDSDGDGVCDPVDNCYDVSNAAQVDTNGDGTGDACNNCTDVATTDTVAAILAARVLCNDDALASGPGACPVAMTPSCAGSLVDDVLALAYGDNNQAVAAVDPVAMIDQIACQTAIGAAVNGYVSTKLHELEVGSDESVAEAAALGNLTPILSACNVTVAQDQTGVVLPSVGPQCAAAVGAMGDDVDADSLHDCLHTLLDVWVQRFGPNPQPLRPNILLIMVDDMRWDEVGPTHTPGGDNMSLTLQEIRDQGINLSNAYASTPLCCPSRSTVLTGAYAHTHGVVDNGTITPVTGGASAFPDASTLATTLQAAGYRTGLVGKYLNNYTLMWSNGQPPYIPPGWDDWYGMKQHLYYNYQLVERPQGGAAVEVSYGSTAADYSTDVIREKTKTFITSAAASNQPFFFFTSFNAPHSPHPGAAQRHLGLFAGLAPWQPPNFNEADVSDKPAWLRNNKPPISPSGLLAIDDDRRDASEMLLSVDEAIGGSVTYGITGIIDTLKATGVYDNTVIIFMSDHGYFWAEHRLAGKPFVYQEDARIPLLIRYPRLVPLPRQDTSLIVTNDLAPTLIELAGAQPLPSSDGKSAVRVLDGTMHNGRADFLLEGWNRNQEFAAVHDGRWKYVEYSPQAGGDIELYDLENDPYELTSLHADPLQAPRIQAMHVRLMQTRPNWPADAP